VFDVLLAAVRSMGLMGRNLLVGVSGGADSVALFFLLREIGCSFQVLHVNHLLRGEESERDEAFVRELCEKFAVPISVRRVDVAARALEMRESMETCARAVRLEFFAEEQDRLGAQAVVLAQHADDQVETMLWNALRGSHGWKGMQAEQCLQVGERTVNLWRPLLGVRSAELRDYLRERNQSWCEDSTNRQAIAVRNRLRHEALPLLAEIAGRDVVPMLLPQLEAQAEDEQVDDWLWAQAAAVDPQGRLHVPRLRELPVGVQVLVIRRYFTEQRISSLSRELLLRCRALVDDLDEHRVNLPSGRYFQRREGRLMVLDG
jgi:tRNA(Ile)-lysidine synthase